MIPLLTGVDGKISVVGNESDTKILTRAIKMIVVLRILRMMGLITLKFAIHPQILIGSLAELDSSARSIASTACCYKLREFEMTK